MVDAVRQSTYTKEEHNQSNDVSSATTSITCSQESPFAPNAIPVISSLALKSLPPNIKAIPLGISAEDGIKIPTNSSVTKSEAVTPVSETNKTSPQINKEKNDEELTAAVNLPIELLNQIVNGNVQLHSMSDKSKETNLVAINTEMGTIPIIPVKGEGGLQLIPIEKDSEPKQDQLNPNLNSNRTVLISGPTTPISFPFTPAAGQTHSSFNGGGRKVTPTSQGLFATFYSFIYIMQTI